MDIKLTDTSAQAGAHLETKRVARSVPRVPLPQSICQVSRNKLRTRRRDGKGGVLASWTLAAKILQMLKEKHRRGVILDLHTASTHCLCDVDRPLRSGPEFLIWKNEGVKLFNGPLCEFTPAQHRLKCPSRLCWNPRRILSGIVRTRARGELRRHAELCSGRRAQTSGLHSAPQSHVLKQSSARARGRNPQTGPLFLI